MIAVSHIYRFQSRKALGVLLTLTPNVSNQTLIIIFIEWPDPSLVSTMHLNCLILTYQRIF